MKKENFIKSEAKKIGIDMVGISRGYKKDRALKALSDRKGKERAIEFEADDIYSRVSPERLLRSYKSIISIAVSYNFNTEPYESEKIRGVVSKSSRGMDYHKVLKHKAEQLMKKVSEVYPKDYYIGVDTSPLMDREIAVSGGIGYFGKNSNIINPEFGSFIFLGYILTELELECDVEIKRNCGDCDLCSRGCPTGAINGDYSIDPKKCISYLTQTKTKIPFELREKMGFKIYGCDACQNICPRNKSVKLGKAESFEPFGASADAYLDDFLNMTNRQFAERFGETSSGWRGKNVIKRNAIIAMGNSMDIKYFEPLKKLLKNPSKIIAEYAIWSLLKLDLEGGMRYLKENGELLDEKLKVECELIYDYFTEEG